MRAMFASLIMLAALYSPAAVAWFGGSACYFPDSSNHRAPDWLCQGGSPRGLITAVGYARATPAGYSFGRNMALADARIKLAQRVQGQCGQRGVSDAVLHNSRLLNFQRSPSGGYYARVGIRSADLVPGC